MYPEGEETTCDADRARQGQAHLGLSQQRLHFLVMLYGGFKGLKET